jgi:hypothetical protein
LPKVLYERLTAVVFLSACRFFYSYFEEESLVMKISGLLKKALAVLFCTVILAVSFSVAACSPDNKTQQIMDKANANISACVVKAQNKADRLLDKGYSSDSKQILEICSELQQDTQKIEKQAEQKLDKLGVAYTSEYYYVNIAGNKVLIDPFKSM